MSSSAGAGVESSPAAPCRTMDRAVFQPRVGGHRDPARGRFRPGADDDERLLSAAAAAPHGRLATVRDLANACSKSPSAAAQLIVADVGAAGRGLRRSRGLRWLGLALVLRGPRRPNIIRPAQDHLIPDRTERGLALDRADPASPPPQLQHHRAHRSWEIHARRPPAGDDLHDRRAADDEPGPRFDGPGAREGDHDQGPRRPLDDEANDGKTMASTSSTRPVTWTSPRGSHSSRPRGGDPRRRRRGQGIEAQTLARPPRHARGPTLIPVLNKIDLPSRTRDDHGRAGERAGDPARGGHPRECQDGPGVAEILEAIVAIVEQPCVFQRDRHAARDRLQQTHVGIRERALALEVDQRQHAAGMLSRDEWNPDRRLRVAARARHQSGIEALVGFGHVLVDDQHLARAQNVRDVADVARRTRRQFDPLPPS